MSGYDNYSDLFDGEGRERQESGSGLRKQLEEALGEIRSLRDQIESKDRQAELTNLFSEKGKDPAAIALVPKGVDPKAWLEENGRLLADAKKAEEPAPKEPEGEPAPEVPAVDPALEQERLAMETLTGVVGSGTGIPSTASADPIAKMQSFQTEEELLAYIRSNGAG